MKKRIYSDSFIQRKIDKIDKMYKECMGENLIVTPECLMPELKYGIYPKLSKREIEQIKNYYRQLQNLSYVRGFWMGYSLRDGIKD